MDTIDSRREFKRPSEEDIPDNIPYRYRIDNGWNPKRGDGFRWGLRDVVDDAVQPFSYFGGSHGAVNERLVLYGGDGIGKRHLAIDIVNKIIAQPGDGRRVFWVHGHSLEAFVRDYLNIYHDFSGSKLPKGLGIPYSLQKVKHMLEERRQEWLMVILNLGRFADHTFSGSTHKLSFYLPERGQIIVTSAAMAKSKFEWTQGPPKISALQIANTAVELGLSHVERHGLLQHTKEHCPVLNSSIDLDILDTLFERLVIYKIDLTVASATMYLLDLDVAQYTRRIKQKSKNANLDGTDPAVLSEIMWDCAMGTLWDALADYDVFTTHVLTALSVVDCSPVPMSLLQKLDVFANTRSERLEPALNTLCSLGLVEITREHEPTVRTHLAIYVSVGEGLLTGISSSQMIISWIKMLPDAVAKDGDPNHYEPEKVWKIFPHIWSITESVRKVYESSQYPSILDFLVRLADCLIVDRTLSNYAGMITDTAYQFWSRMTSDESVDVLRNQYLYIRMKQCRIEALLAVGEQRMAETDLRRAQNAFMINELHEEYPTLRRKTEELEVRVLFSQERYQEVEQTLDIILRNPEPGLSPRGLAVRHDYMSRALDLQGISVAAYQYSCCVMTYWVNLPDDERWGQTDILCLNWLDHHCSLLVRLGKFRGALTFLEDLTDAWLEWAPYGNGGTQIYRFLNNMVFCYASKNYFDDAERTVIRMLELCSVADLDVEPLMIVLSALCELGICYVRFGHLVEAEAVFQFILAMARKTQADGLVEEDYVWAVDWWAQLLFVLMAQDKHEEARKVRDEWQTEHHDESYVDGYLKNAKVRHARGIDVYQRALWAEEDGKLKEFKSLIEGTDDSGALKRMVKMFGSVRWRVKEQCDWVSDLDVWEVEKASKSRILHLLGQDITYYYPDITELCFEGKYGKVEAGDDAEGQQDEREQSVKDHETEAEEEPQGKGHIQMTKKSDTESKGPSERLETEKSKSRLGHRWSHPKQRLLHHYWRWCRCRYRRTRSQSMETFAWHEKRLTLERVADEDQSTPELTQTTLDDYFYTLTQAPVFADGCKDDCPCRDANLQGPIDYEDLIEDRLWLWREPVSDPPELSAPKHYLKKFEKPKSGLLPNEVYELDETNALQSGDSARGPPDVALPSSLPALSSTATSPVDLKDGDRSAYEPTPYRPGSTWKWMQMELLAGEGRDENYILPRCLYIPVVTITGTEDEKETLWGSRETEPRQMLIMEMLERERRWEVVLRGADEFELGLGVI